MPRELTPKEQWERFVGAVTKCVRPEVTTVPGVCDVCGEHGQVYSLVVDHPDGTWSLEMRCEEHRGQ